MATQLHENTHEAIEAKLRAGRSGIIPAVSLQIRQADGDRKTRFIEGRAVPYNVEQDIGWYFESVAQGTFNKSIKEAARALPLLLFHDAYNLGSIVGRADSWDDRSDGLYGVWAMEDHDEAQRAADMAASGALAYLSVGFQPTQGGSEFHWDDEDRAHVLRSDARLLETSLTPTPAYGQAYVTKVRHTPDFQPTRRNRISKWRSWREAVL